MKMKTQMTALIIAFAMLFSVGPSAVWANDYSIYGNRISALIQGNADVPAQSNIARLDNLSVYGHGIDMILADSSRPEYPNLVAGLGDMSVYGETMNTYIRAGWVAPSFNCRFVNHLVYAK